MPTRMTTCLTLRVVVDEDARIMLTMDYDLFNGFSTDSRVESSAWRVEEARAIRLRTECSVRLKRHSARLECLQDA